MIQLSSIEEIRAHAGQTACTGPWIELPQALISQFGTLTGDEQWIHMDPGRAATESPFGATVAHGFLTLALLSRLLRDCYGFPNRKAGVNYGMDKLRFISPVRAGSRVRGRFALEATRDIGDGQVECTWNAQVEIEGQAKPALAATWLLRMTY